MSLDVRGPLGPLDLVDLLALAKVRVVQLLRSAGRVSVIRRGGDRAGAGDEARRTMLASRFAVETALSFSSTFASGSSISVSFVPAPYRT